MTPEERTEYIVESLQQHRAISPEDAKALLAAHQADVLTHLRGLIVDAMEGGPIYREPGLAFAAGMINCMIGILAGQPARPTAGGR